jgi:flagellar secretion chaperone FliS
MSKNTYLEAKVLTAPTYRLQLMLIEGAIRFGRQAEQSLASGDVVAATPTLIRVLDIMGELTAGVRHKQTELNRKIADLYLFILRRVAEAKINDDAAPLREALELLEYERQTWQLVCERMESEGIGTIPALPKVVAPSVPRPAIVPHLGASALPTSAPSLGISLEA